MQDSTYFPPKVQQVAGGQGQEYATSGSGRLEPFDEKAGASDQHAC
jgi:hypothetical protein